MATTSGNGGGAGLLGGPAGLVLGTGLGAVSSIYGSKKQAQAQKDANAITTKYNDLALAAQKEQQGYDRTQNAADRARQATLDAEALREYNQTFGFNQSQADLAQSNLVNRRDYSRGQFGNYLSRLQPFAQAGQQATANLASVLGRALPASIPTAGSGGGAMVRLQSPDGKVQDVPAEHAAHYLSMGAVKV